MTAVERAKRGWKREGWREGRKTERGPPVAAAKGDRVEERAKGQQNVPMTRSSGPVSPQTLVY